MSNDLSKKAAEIMGWTTRVFEETNQFCYGEGVNPYPWSLRMDVDKWNPLTNDNHLSMVRDRLVELGFEHYASYYKNFLRIFVELPDLIYPNNFIKKEGKEINLTTLTAYVEAFEKWKVLNDVQ